MFFNFCFLCRRIVEIKIAKTTRIRDNCSFQEEEKGYYKGSKKYYVITHLPLTKEGFVYQLRHDGDGETTVQQQD